MDHDWAQGPHAFVCHRHLVEIDALFAVLDCWPYPIYWSANINNNPGCLYPNYTVFGLDVTLIHDLLPCLQS